jgi:predicted nucleotidyltransferase
VGTRAEPRTTRDIDVAVAVADDRAAEALAAALGAAGYRIGAILEHDALCRLATVRLTSPVASVLVDLLFSSSGIEGAIAIAAERLEIVPGLRIPVARTGHLIALKLLARDDRRRPQDHDDLRALRSGADESDWSLAAEAAVAIERAGASRGRDLMGALDRLRAGDD